ncbi:MAG: Hsp20 family protein [Acidobacteria bacterium]|nr:Hsp20 family protein [Acidobacteriota bacterium]
MVELKTSENPQKMKDIIFDELRRDLADWMTAKEDLVWRPPVDLTEEDGEFAVRALVPGADSKDIEVLVAPEILLIRGMTRGRAVLRSIELPRAIDPTRVHAEIMDGMLSIRAEIAGARKAVIMMPRAA